MTVDSRLARDQSGLERLYEAVHPVAGAKLANPAEARALETRFDLFERVGSPLLRADQHINCEEGAGDRADPAGLHDVVADHEAAARDERAKNAGVERVVLRGAVLVDDRGEPCEIVAGRQWVLLEVARDERDPVE